jgi:hypothetical protein
MCSRIMYIECKAGTLNGTARIGRVVYSKSGRSVRYRRQTFQRTKRAGFKANYLEVESGDPYWISGPKRKGGDRLYVSALTVGIDEDAREEYWCTIREAPDRRNQCTAD